MREFAINEEYGLIFIDIRHIWRLVKINFKSTDDAILKEMGERLARVRLERNLTQAALAEQAGVSKRTVERLEAGAVATQLSGFVRICRVLGLLEGLEHLIPDATPGPIEQLKRKNRPRKRASATNAAVAKPTQWKWGDES